MNVQLGNAIARKAGSQRQIAAFALSGKTVCRDEAVPLDGTEKICASGGEGAACEQVEGEDETPVNLSLAVKRKRRKRTRLATKQCSTREYSAPLRGDL